MYNSRTAVVKNVKVKFYLYCDLYFICVVILNLKSIFNYDDEILCIVKEMFGSKVYNDIVNILYSQKNILKAYYGFRVLYVFPFPSAGH